MQENLRNRGEAQDLGGVSTGKDSGFSSGFSFVLRNKNSLGMAKPLDHLHITYLKQWLATVFEVKQELKRQLAQHLCHFRDYLACDLGRHRPPGAGHQSSR